MGDIYKIKIDTKNIYKSLNEFEKKYDKEIGMGLYHDIRTYIKKNKGLNYDLKFIRFGDYFLIKYKDINGFNWELKGIPTYSGGLTSMNPYIKKLCKGVLLIKSKRHTKKIFGNIKKPFNEFEFIDKYNIPIIAEIANNLFFYEYTEDVTFTLLLEEVRGSVLKIKGD